MKRSLLIILLIAIGVTIYSVDKKAERIISPNTPEATTTSPVVTKKEVTIMFNPENPIQGEPVLVSVENLSGTTTVRSASFNGKALGVFENKALLGLDLRQTTGSYLLSVILSDGRTLSKNLTVGKRVIVQAPLGIPDSLGGNTPQAERELLNTLAQEGAIINAIPTSLEKLWNGSFQLPLKGEITVTDVYGYSRLTGASTIAHKGTDFRATVGTPVYAMNDGLVAYVGNLRNYGKVIALDHGSGILTIYMHLEEIVASKATMVRKGELIARSGATGYVLGPHLHLTVRINQISIDPEKFMELVGH